MVDPVDVGQLLLGVALWIHGSRAGDPLAVNIGFLNVAVVVGSRLGWL